MDGSESSFEKTYRELELTVQKLEAGNLTLDESMKLYERGMELAHQCGEMLDKAEQRIKAQGLALREVSELYLLEGEGEEEGE